MHAIQVEPRSRAGSVRALRVFAALALWLGAAGSAAAAHVLMVVGNTTLNSGDTAVYNRLVNQGHAVTVVSGAASTTNDAAGKNLVMISSTITSTDVNTKFRDISTAVMVWESALFDDMGLTGAAATDLGTATAQTQLAVTAGTPLSAALSGLTTVTASAQTFTWGAPNAATAIQAATLVGAPAGRSGLFAYAKGANMAAGVAAGARVGLFLNDATAAALGVDGWTLFDTALGWALAQAPVATESLRANPEPAGPSSRRTGLVFSEIMYNPAFRADQRDTEFIEIQNNEPFSRDIGGYSLDGAVSYTFPSPTVLAAGARVVVARTPADLQAVHGLTGVLGPYTGSLDNGGGELRLLHRLGAVLLDLAYDDEEPWPKAPDGGGPSLTLARPSFGEADAAAWSPSAMNGGTPGAAETWPANPWRGLVVNEVLANTSLPAQDFVELFNHSPADINLGGVLLADNPTSNRYAIAANTILGPGEKMYFSELQLGFSFDPAGEAVFVFSPSGDRVIDAVAFGPTENGVPLGRYPDGAPEFRELQLPTPGLDNQPLKHRPVVINEIMYNPLSRNRDDEYIELHNTGGEAVSLAGWQLAGAVGFVFPADSSIAPGGYLVISRNRARFLTRYPAVAPAAVLGDYSGSLADSGDRIRLRAPQNPAFPGVNLMEMDEVEYRDGGSWGVWADGGGSSLELTDPLGDNRRAANWADSDETAKAGWTAFSTTGLIDNTASGTPGTPNELHVLNLEAGECLVDKIVVRRDTDAGATNRVANGDFEANLNGWILQGNHDTSARHTAGGAGGSAASLRLTATGDGDNGVNRAEIDLTTALASGQTATISGQARWLRGSTNLLLRLKGNGLEAVAGLVVPSNLGTPGAVNSRRVTNAGPSIREVRHFPVLPAALEEVTVSARVEDADEVTLVNLRYRVDPSAVVTTVAMSDAGTGGDAVAGDGIWTARIPGQASGAVVAFTLEALDYAPAVASRIFPPDAPVNECLIRWGDAPVTNVFTPYRLWTTAANQALWISRQKLSNALIPGSFVYGNFRVVHGAGMRYRGSPFIRPSYDSPVSGRLANLVFRVPEDEDVMGATAFNLDAMEQDFRDGSLQREAMAFWLAEQMGAPFIHQRFATLVINGVKRGEVYQDSQQPNGDYLDCWFPGESDGELYEIDDWFEFNDSNPVGREFNGDATLARFTTAGGAKKRARYRWSWQRKGLDADGDSPAGIFSLVETMNAADDASFLAAVRRDIDVTSWWRDFTVRRVFGDWDGYGYNRGKNTFLYRAPGGKWKLLLWDLDFTAGAGSRATDNGLFAEIQDPVLSRFYNLDPLERVYWGMLKAAANGPMSPSGYNARSDEMHAVFLANGVNAASPATAQTWVAGRRTYILGQLAAVNASFAITTNGGNNFSSAASPVTISGTSPVDAATLTLNGQPIDVTWTSVTAWTATVFPQPGANTLVFSARDALGNPLPALMDTIVVTYTGGGAPVVGNVAITEVMYNPPDQAPHNGGDIEFIEIKNTGSQPVNLGGASFNAGVTYTFPAGTTLAPGAFLLLASSSTVFNAVYPWRSAAGDYEGQLSNGGETLTLVDGAGNVVSSFTYDDIAPWPVAADGAGFSLVPANPNPSGSMNTGALWRASSWVGGSPGMDDPAPVAAAPLITQQPLTLTVDAGQTARFICLATGYPQPTYQWRRNGVDIPGANSPAFTTAPATAADSGTRYDCRVTNANGALTSASALLVVRSQVPLTRSDSCQVVYYPFREGAGTTVNDVSGFGTPLNLSFTGSGVSWLPGRNGVNVTSSSVIASAAAAAKVHTAIQTSKAMTVELWAKPQNTAPPVLARLIGVSADTNNRNFGMMQNAADLEFRVRTSVTGNNGAPATSAAGAIRTTPMHYVATFTEAGGVKIYTNGVQAATGNPGGNIANWNSAYRLVLANEPAGNRAWLGELYLASIHSCELTPAQIQQNFAAGSNPNPFATLPPSITSTPAGQTIACATLLPPPATNDVAVTWNCSSTGTVVAADTDLGGGGGCPGNARLIRRVFTAIDRCGFMSTSTQTFSVVDNVAPVVTCPAPPPVNVGSACTAPAGDYRALATVSDGCSSGPFTVTQSPAPGTMLAAGTHTITLSTTDACGNTGSCAFPLTVRDVTPPTVVCATIPYTRTVGANCTATVPKVAPFISDNCTPALSVVVAQEPLNGATIGPGTHTIVVTATDAAGNSSQCSATLIVSDTTAPVITCPPAVTLPAGPSCQAAVPALTPVSVTDNCGAAGLVVTQSPAAGSLVGPGTHTVTLTATDAAGNRDSCTLVLTVRDGSAPTFTCPADILLDAEADCAAALPALPVADLADNCETGGVVVVQIPAAGTRLPTGVHTVRIRATDQAGNPTECLVTATVRDVTPPAVNCPNPLQLEAGPACQASLPALSAFAFDACTVSNQLVVVQSPAAGTPLTTGTHVITVSASDAAGNTSNCVVNVIVVDAAAPTLVCPGPITLDITACTAPAPDLVPAIVAGAMDSCTATNQFVATQVPAAGTPLPPGDHTLLVRVADAAGNVAECSVAMAVRDIAPVALVCPPDLTVAFGADTTPATTGTAVTTNACGEAVAVEFTDSVVAGACPQSFDIRRTWTATAASGQTTYCEQVIRVRDTAAPVITAPADQTVACAGDIPAATAADDHDPAPAIAFQDQNLGGNGCAASPGQIRRTWTATDACGNTSTVARVFTVIDNVRPVVVSSPLDRLVQCLGDLPAVPEAPVFVDNCDANLVVIVQRIDQFSSVNCARTVLYNWAATDDCGNRTRVTQRYIVRDTQRPVILTCPAGGTMDSLDQVPAATPDALVAADNCDTSPTITFSTQLVDLPGCPARIDRTYTVVDDCGNIRTCVQSWTVNLPGGAPSVWTQPQDQTAAVGQSATFSVAAAGCSTLSYQWWRDGSALSGATGAQFTTAPLGNLDTGSQFWCVITSAEGETTTRRALITLPSVARSLAPIPLEIMEVPANGDMDISLPSESGVVYRLQKTDSLQPPDWINCGPGAWGNGALLVIPDPADSPRRRYYRVVGYPQLPATP